MPKNLLYDIAFYAMLFFIVFFLSAVVISQVVLKGEAVTVPDLTGKTVTQARAELVKKDLSVAQRGTEFDDRWERGLIVRQDPAPGSRIRVTKLVQVVTSLGSEKVTVPDVQSRSLDNVLTLLREAGLVRGKLSQVHTPALPAGRVIAQRPAPDSIVERNSPVGLLISQGGLERRYVMPDLIYRRADRVLARLQAWDFKVADIRYVYYPGLAPGIIVKQDPPNGFRIQKRNRISLEVSR
jgi:eukaryotic-like serine/threonine-protein kinase